VILSSGKNYWVKSMARSVNGSRYCYAPLVGLLDRSIETAGIPATLSVVGPFRNLHDTKVSKAQIGLQKISSAIVGSELWLIGRYQEQEFLNEVESSMNKLVK
jgi:hypothetical protein